MFSYNVNVITFLLCRATSLTYAFMYLNVYVSSVKSKSLTYMPNALRYLLQNDVLDT